MMRPSTVLWIALAGGVGVGVYQLKHRVQALEDELFRLNRTIVQEQDAIHVLRAEWAYINQPQRLEALAQRHLSMQAMTPAQMGQVADLPRRPPPPPTPAPEPVLAALPATPPAAPATTPAAGAARAPQGTQVTPPRAQTVSTQPATTQTATTQTATTQTEGRPPAEGRASAPAARAPVPALASNSRAPAAPQPRQTAEPSIADLLGAMRPPPRSAPAGAVGDAYAGAVNVRASPPAARMPAPRGIASPDIQAAGGPAAVGGR